MANSTELAHALRGFCPPPFFQEELFANMTTGCELQRPCASREYCINATLPVLPGRLCSKTAPNIHCCLPCPSTDWLYPDSFHTITQVSSWINVAGLASTLFLLLSFACLPVEKTHRHYLSICLTISVVIMQVCFLNNL